MWGRWDVLGYSRIGGSKCLPDFSKVNLIETKKRVTYFFPLVEFLLYLVSFSTSRKHQLNWTLLTLLQSSGLLSIVLILKIFKNAR